MRLKLVFVALSFLISSQFARAQSTTTNGEGEAAPIADSQKFFGAFAYAPLDFVVPNKWGVTLGFREHQTKTLEIEYLRGSLSTPFLIGDLGSLTDQKLSLIRRQFSEGSSFNYSYGLSYFAFSLHLGDSLLSRVTGGTYPSIDLVELQSLGFNAGIGNRWTFSQNWFFGVDWIAWYQPLVTLKRQSAFLDYASNQQDKDNVDKAVRFVSHLPRLSLLKFQLARSF